MSWASACRQCQDLSGLSALSFLTHASATDNCLSAKTLGDAIKVDARMMAHIYTPRGDLTVDVILPFCY